MEKPLKESRLNELKELLRHLGLPEANESISCYELIDEALTHSSYKADYKGSYDYERLEFFGDSVLKFVVSEYLFKRFPTYSEGRLTEIRAVVVSAKILDDIGIKLNLGKYILLGRGIHIKSSMIGRSFEALFGAVYLAFGTETVTEMINRLLAEKIEDIHQDATRDNFKAQLQEFTQAQGKGVPSYAIVAVEGPAHDPLFSVTVSIQGELIASGSGHSKKIAEQAAAEQALIKLTETR